MNASSSGGRVDQVKRGDVAPTQFGNDLGCRKADQLLVHAGISDRASVIICGMDRRACCPDWQSWTKVPLALINGTL
jgi:hypothetical protein